MLKYFRADYLILVMAILCYIVAYRTAAPIETNKRIQVKTPYLEKLCIDDSFSNAGSEQKYTGGKLFYSKSIF